MSTAPAVYGLVQSSQKLHIITGFHRPGACSVAVCGTPRVYPLESEAATTAPGFVQPANVCRRCAKVLGQTVRALPRP